MQKFNKDLGGWNMIGQPLFDQLQSYSDKKWSDQFTELIVKMLKDGCGYALYNLYANTPSESVLVDIASTHCLTLKKPPMSLRSLQKLVMTGQPIPSNVKLKHAQVDESDKVCMQARIKCGNCGAEESNTPYKQCGTCRHMYYCSKQCQVDHWSVHKGICK